jgi:hypothetical protein
VFGIAFASIAIAIGGLSAAILACWSCVRSGATSPTADLPEGTPMATPTDLSRLYPVDHIQVIVTSFGYGHGPAPEADIILDTRRHLRNPHANRAMRQLTGIDPSVRQQVLTTPGVRTTPSRAPDRPTERPERPA